MKDILFPTKASQEQFRAFTILSHAVDTEKGR